MRIWTINEGKLYTLAYIAESSQYDRYLPQFQGMVDTFSIDSTSQGGRAPQVQSTEDNDERQSPSPPDSGTDLAIDINIAKNPIARGNEQTITMTVSDSNSGNKISGASINGYVKYVTTHREIFSGSTDQNGVLFHSWRISGNANTGTFTAHADASSGGGKSGSGEKSFQVIAKGTSQDNGSISPGECSNEPGSAGLKFPQDERTECELEEWNKCKDIRKNVGQTNWGAKCDNIDELFMDDDCFGFNNATECDEWFNNGKEKFCEKYPNHKKCANTEPEPDCGEGYVLHNGECKPICGEGQYGPGESCIDDGDEITCDGPAVPVGNECVLPPENPPLDDPCGIGQPRIPEDKDCDGQIDPEFGEPDKPIPDEEETEDESDSEESDNESEESDDGSNGDGSNADSGDSSDGEVFATD
jgi:hypothetical protein